MWRVTIKLVNDQLPMEYMMGWTEVESFMTTLNEEHRGQVELLTIVKIQQ